MSFFRINYPHGANLCSGCRQCQNELSNPSVQEKIKCLATVVFCFSGGVSGLGAIYQAHIEADSYLFTLFAVNTSLNLCATLLSHYSIENYVHTERPPELQML